MSCETKFTGEVEAGTPLDCFRPDMDTDRLTDHTSWSANSHISMHPIPTRQS